MINWTKAQIEDIVNLYQRGESTLKIAKKYQVSDQTVASVIRKAGYKVRSSNSEYISKQVNHRYFEEINDEHKAYWLGMLIADGSVSKKGDISITLKSHDLYLLEQFKRDTCSNHAITKTRTCYKFGFRSKIMSDDLSKYGVVPRKSHKETFLPNLKEDLMPHLVRGIFDGDGTVYEQKNVAYGLIWGFYGSHRLCTDIRDFLCEELEISRRKVIHKEGNNVSFVYFGNKLDTQKFYRFLYNTATLYMHRKRSVFEKFLC